MKNVTYLIIVLFASLALVFTTRTAMTQDYAKVMPNDVKVIIDNDRVRVLDVIHRPGAKEPMHSHPAYVSVFLTAARTKTTLPDGKTFDKVFKAGDVVFREAITHQVENVGTADQHIIVIELKK
jgi:quercetin dioxygenase-like cupin family protein